MELLNPKNDYVFKRIFADAPDLLAELINAIRHDRPPIRELTVLNPEILPDELKGKYIGLDIRAVDVAGYIYNVEMQVRRYADWSARSSYYLARMLSQQINEGGDYSQLTPAIGIHLLDFDLFGEYPFDYAWRFAMRDHNNTEVALGDELQLDILELRKADRLGAGTDPLQNWIAFTEHWHDLANQADFNYEPVRRAMEKLKTLSADQEAQRLAFVRERAVRDEKSLLKQAREEGTHQGELRRARRDLLKLLEKRFGPASETIRDRINAASETELDEWLDQVFDGHMPEALQAD